MLHVLHLDSAQEELFGRSFLAENMFVLHKVQPTYSKLFQRFKNGDISRRHLTNLTEKPLMIH